MYTLVFPYHKCFIQNLALIGQAVSEMISYYGNIHVYCQGWGQMKAWGPIFSES